MVGIGWAAFPSLGGIVASIIGAVVVRSTVGSHIVWRVQSNVHTEYVSAGRASYFSKRWYRGTSAAAQQAAAPVG